MIMGSTRTLAFFCGLTIILLTFSIQDASAVTKPCSVSKFIEACDSICGGEEDTCNRPQYNGHFCLCTTNDPEAISGEDKEYDCMEIDVEHEGDERKKRSMDGEDEEAKEESEDDRDERSLEKKQKMKHCFKMCQKQDDSLIPYMCKTTKDGKKAKLPKHMCACSSVSGGGA